MTIRKSYPVYLFLLILMAVFMTDCNRKTSKNSVGPSASVKMDSTLDTMLIIGEDPVKIDTETLDSFLYLKYLRGACFGRCPVYSIEVYGDGRIVYDAKMFTKRKGIYEGRLNKAELDDLKKRIEKLNFKNLSPMYPEDRSLYIPDLPNKEMTISYASWTHKVIDNHSAPERLKALERLLDEQMRYHSSLKRKTTEK